MATEGLDGSCASNTVWWDDATDALLLSHDTSATVFEIQRASGDTTRWFGQLEGAWSFDPPEAGFWWQHGVHLTDEGNLGSDRQEVDRMSTGSWARPRPPTTPRSPPPTGPAMACTPRRSADRPRGCGWGA